MMLTSPGLAHETNLTGEDHVLDEPKAGSQIRMFTVHAIEVDLVYNRFGLHQPNATVYVLEEDLEEAREASGKIPCGNSVVQQDRPFCDEPPKNKQADDVDTRVLPTAGDPRQRGRHH